MLFDLRGRGRRRTVQAIYLGLAVLMGGGLIFFGVGGTGVGLFNSGNNGGGGSGNDVLEKQLTRAERAVKRRPQDPQAWSNLASVRFRDAGTGDNADSSGTTLVYKPSGQKQLRLAARAWGRYLTLEPKSPDPQLAGQMSNVFRALGDAKGLVGTLEVLAEDKPSAGIFQQLALAAYAAKQQRKGDLAAADAIKRTPKGSRQQVKSALNAAKAQIAQGATGGSPGAQSAPVTPQPKG